MDSIRREKSAHRAWRFRTRVPDITLRYIAPSPTIFSPWTKRLGILVALFMGPAIALSFSTNAAFSDEDRLRSNDIGTGVWVPDIRLEEKGDCVRLISSLDAAIIYYKFAHDGDPRTDGAISDGKCVKIPQERRGKEILFEAIAFHPENDEWRSQVLMRTLSHRSFSARGDREGDRKKQSDREHSDDDRDQSQVGIERDVKSESRGGEDRDSGRKERCHLAHDEQRGEGSVAAGECANANTDDCDESFLQEKITAPLADDDRDRGGVSHEMNPEDEGDPDSLLPGRKPETLPPTSAPSGQNAPDVLQKEG